MKRTLLKDQKGVALVMALVMLIVLTLVGVSSISSTVFETKISGNERVGSAAFYAADGGVGVGIGRIPDTTAYSGNITSDVSYRSGNMSPNTPQPLKTLGIISRPGFETVWEYRRFQVNATGESSGAKKEIEVQISFGPNPSGTEYNN